MKFVRAIVRPERERDVIESLESEGIYALTKTPVLGRGIERGIQVGAVSYDELAKVMLMIVVDDDRLAKTVQAIVTGARTDHPGDGKIFVEEVREVYSIRNAGRE